jgi:hypothetical protein
MYNARVLTFTLAAPARPARRPAPAGRRTAARRLSQRLGLRRRAHRASSPAENAPALG